MLVTVRRHKCRVPFRSAERLRRSGAAGVTYEEKGADAVGVFHVAAVEDGHTPGQRSSVPWALEDAKGIAIVFDLARIRGALTRLEPFQAAASKGVVENRLKATNVTRPIRAARVRPHASSSSKLLSLPVPCLPDQTPLDRVIAAEAASMRFLLDANMLRSTVRATQRLGHEAVDVSDVGLDGAESARG